MYIFRYGYWKMFSWYYYARCVTRSKRQTNQNDRVKDSLKLRSSIPSGQYPI